MNTHVAPETLARQTLSQIARDCLASSPDIRSAVPEFLRRIGGDPALMAALMEGHEEKLAGAYLRHIIGAQRARAWPDGQDGKGAAPGQLTTAENSARSAALVQGVMSAWFDIRLPYGKTLGAATRADLDRAADFYRSRGRTMLARGEWLARIAARMEEGRTVAETFSSAELGDLLRATSGDAA